MNNPIYIENNFKKTCNWYIVYFAWFRLQYINYDVSMYLLYKGLWILHW